MKSLLIGINAKYIHPAVALYQLKANTNTPVVILEFTIKETTEAIFAKIYDHLYLGDYTLIGFSCYLWNIEKIIHITKMIKQYFPKIVIVLGGPEVGYDAKYYLANHHQIDYIFTKEGEDSFHELCMHLDGIIPLEAVSNLCYFKNGNYLENNIKLPDLQKITLATLQIPDLTHRIVYLESSRGCPYHCSYCTAALENKLRFFPLATIKQILKTIMESSYPVVKFLDRTFNANPQYMKEILSFINDHNRVTVFQFEIIVETLSTEMIEYIKTLKRKWLRFEVGIQSTNEEVNLAVHRKQNMQLVKEKIALLQQTNRVDIHVDLIAGLPFETKESFQKSFHEAFLLHTKELQLGFLKFLRGTKLLDMVDAHEYIYDKLPPYEIMQNKYLSQEDLRDIHIVERALNQYYNSGFFVRFFDYLLEQQLLENAYEFFKQLYQDIHHHQLDHLCRLLDTFCKCHFQEHYNKLHFLIIQDYLCHYQVRPKVWWEESLTKEQRKTIYPCFIRAYPELTLEILYRYATMVLHQNEAFIILYQNHQRKTYFLTLHT